MSLLSTCIFSSKFLASIKFILFKLKTLDISSVGLILTNFAYLGPNRSSNYSLMYLIA